MMSHKAQVVNLEEHRGARVADLDNGYMRTAIELQEALCRVNLSGREFRVVAAIMRLTYGWQKKEDRIANIQISDETGIASNHVAELLKSLAARNIIFVGTGHNHLLSINKAVSEWVLDKPKSPKTGSNNPKNGTKNNPETGLNNPETGLNSPENGTEKSRKRDTPKIKDKSTKDIIPKISVLFDEWYSIYPNKKSKIEAAKAYTKTIKANPDLSNQLLESLKAQIQNRTEVSRYNLTAPFGKDIFLPEWKNPTTWLNQGCWDDDLFTVPVAALSAPQNQSTQHPAPRSRAEQREEISKAVMDVRNTDW